MAPGTSPDVIIDNSARVDETAVIGSGTKIWAFVQVAEYAEIGKDCIVGNGAYIDRHVIVGNNVRIHNKALLYQGVQIEDDVFIGPAVCFTNDRWPRSGKTRDLKGVKWTVGKGACLGANVTVLPDIQIGRYAVVGAGSLVSKDVPDYALVYGNPAVLKGVTCSCRYVYQKSFPEGASSTTFECEKCGKELPRLEINTKGN